ncbi:S-adenosyl-L-methionine-dependent methyltransferase [Aspergillus fijiensis CBS 313.89]|uniref:S-adenosyl-L-methionine-dependent methyltransferase n=1 Tax=Aspergillus fijiensis CBS 313.89 TaxID=1448319 RepID=A0A8G1RVH5_9EURO|nr:S-adenosyl-L-methionine-dependent methyltransferase [Aspergillus fijiensis CBS 313.89]RAK80300.1 S-adenosyl-L-methionine-dependent methyltransferase [Aspergillus fijiensis CBS 313.89]
MRLSIRLNEQHLLWKLQTGHVLSPLVPRRPGLRVADLGTGTGIWCLELSRAIDTEKVEIVGYDVSSDAFPPRSTLPQNVELNTLDLMSDQIPEDMLAAFDVVHLRLWACVVRNNCPGKLIRLAEALLKPGGYLQWEEVDRDTSGVLSKPMQRLEHVYSHFLEEQHLDPSWVKTLPDTLRKHGFDVTEATLGSWTDTVRGQYYHNYLSGVLGILQSNLAQGKDEEHGWLEDLARESSGQRGVDHGLAWNPLQIVARKTDLALAPGNSVASA